MRHRLKIASAPIWTWLWAFSTVLTVFFAAEAGDAQTAGGADKEIVLLAFGDSLTAGYRLPPDKSFPAQLEAALRKKGYNVRVINSGVSGDTAADGLDRLDWSLGEPVDGAVVEFGANDALRGIDPATTRQVLDEMLKQLDARHIQLLLAGMEAPRNWGKDYDDRFRAMYADLAEKHHAVFYPFFLRDVATVPSLNLSDGLHPTPAGVERIVQNILPDVETLIARIRERRTAGPS